ncbi:MAG: hypothetical protein EAZ40_15545 [Rhodobacterales bacterium]|nr:MAG: hypothetical protein EAZ40_15545 [Rhodobacterales bacterium]
MHTLSILRHSILQIIRQPVDVLRIFLLPMTASFLIVKLTGLAFTLSPFYLNIAFARGLVPWGRLAAVTLVTLLIGLWAAAAWHRFVLLADRPRGFWPVVPWPAFLAFLRRGLAVGLLALLIIFAASFVYGLVLGFASASTKRPPGLLAHAIGLGLSLPILVMSLRLAVALPGAAVQAKHSMGGIWSHMSDLFFTMLGLMIALVTLRYLVGEGLSSLGLTPITNLGFLVVAILESLQIILSLSIVTTLYGRYIEGRPLV